MRTSTFTTQPIFDLLRRQTVATLPEISEALGHPSHRTVCRRIAEAECRSSYSHCGCPPAPQPTRSFAKRWAPLSVNWTSTSGTCCRATSIAAGSESRAGRHRLAAGLRMAGGTGIAAGGEPLPNRHGMLLVS